MIRIRSIRFRLTVWYLTVLSTAMVAFGVVVWSVLGYVLWHSYESDLDQDLGAFEQFLEQESRGNTIADLREETREYSTGLPAADGLRVWDRSGQLLFERPAKPGAVLRRRQTVSARGMQLQAELAIPLGDYYATVSMLKWVLIGSLPIVLATAGMGGWWLARRALAPVDAMTREARAISVNDLSARLSVPSTGDELERLADTWNELLSRIESSVQTVTRFTADAAHELRTPVAVIQTSAELALRHRQSWESCRETLHGIQRQTEHITNLLDRLLLLAKGDAGQLKLQFDAVVFSEILRSLKDEVSPLAISKGVQIDWDLPSQEPLVWADGLALRQLVLILTDNALKFTDNGGRVSIGLRAQGNRCVLEIADTGCGITADEMPYIFDRFYRADSARTSGGGTGLGLAIARTIVDAHRGTIEVTSSSEQGTMFRVTLPSMISTAELSNV